SAAQRSVALPRDVRGHPHGRRADRGDAGPLGPPAHRSNRRPRACHGVEGPVRAPAAPRRTGRDVAPRGYAERDADPDRTRVRGAAPLHGRRVARASVATVEAACRAGGNAPEETGPSRIPGGIAIVPVRGGSPLHVDGGTPDARPAGSG